MVKEIQQQRLQVKKDKIRDVMLKNYNPATLERRDYEEEEV